MWHKLPVKDRMDLMRSYRKGGYSYRDAVSDYNSSYQKFPGGGTFISGSGPVNTESTANVSQPMIAPDYNYNNNYNAYISPSVGGTLFGANARFGSVNVGANVFRTKGFTDDYSGETYKPQYFPQVNVGYVKKFPDGGTYKTSNPKDQRIQMYNDSLTLHNYSLSPKENFGKPESDAYNRLSVANRDSPMAIGHVNNAIYEKPKQKVMYQPKPEAIKPPATKLAELEARNKNQNEVYYSDKLQYDNAVKMRNDSLYAYNTFTKPLLNNDPKDRFGNKLEGYDLENYKREQKYIFGKNEKTSTSSHGNAKIDSLSYIKGINLNINDQPNKYVNSIKKLNKSILPKNYTFQDNYFAANFDKPKDIPVWKPVDETVKPKAKIANNATPTVEPIIKKDLKGRIFGSHKTNIGTQYHYTTPDGIRHFIPQAEWNRLQNIK